MKLNLIQKDKRGTIYSITDKDLPFEEITLFFTKGGYARGGCIHRKNDENFCVISGTIKYVRGENSKDAHYYFSTGKAEIIPKNTPHYFLSVTDSVVMEWGATIAEKQEKHSKTRKIVEELNAH